MSAKHPNSTSQLSKAFGMGIENIGKSNRQGYRRILNTEYRIFYCESSASRKGSGLIWLGLDEGFSNSPVLQGRENESPTKNLRPADLPMALMVSGSWAR